MVSGKARILAETLRLPSLPAVAGAAGLAVWNLKGTDISFMPVFCWMTKCRCGPELKPVFPERAIFWPARMRAPGLTLTLARSRCA